MESIRVSSLRLAVSLSNVHSTGTHCLIEWDEPGSPVSIVERKNVKAVDDNSELNVGDMCSVRCRE